MLFVHGGGWHLCDEVAHEDDAIRLARRGYVVTTTNDRLVPDGTFPKA